MKKVDLWASDSDDSLGHTEQNFSADHYKRQYQLEMKRRIELEVLVQQQHADIQRLKSQLAAHLSNLSSGARSDSDTDLFGQRPKHTAPNNTTAPEPSFQADEDSDQHPESGEARMSTDLTGIARSISPLPLLPADDARWDELAQQEQERRKQARRANKGKSLRLPLKAAVQQLAGKVEPAPARAESTPPEHTFPQPHNEFAEEVGPAEEVDQSISKEKRFRAPRKRTIRPEAGMRRLNARSLPRDFASLSSIKAQLAALESVPEKAALAVGVSLPAPGSFGESDDSGWDSDEITSSLGETPQEMPTSAQRNDGAPNNNCTHDRSCSVRNGVVEEVDDAGLDAVLISWARGKRLVDLLNTLQAIAPVGTFPQLPVLGPSASQSEVRKNYLRAVRCCHPDKLTNSTGRCARDIDLLERMFTVLCDSYALHSSSVSQSQVESS